MGASVRGSTVVATGVVPSLPAEVVARLPVAAGACYANAMLRTGCRHLFCLLLPRCRGINRPLSLGFSVVGLWAFAQHWVVLRWFLELLLLYHVTLPGNVQFACRYTRRGQ